jgi:hypothetical protein
MGWRHLAGLRHSREVTSLRPEEQLAAACIRSALPGIEVEQHDDNSEPAMHDLNLVLRGRPFGAVEVTAAMDSESTELWNLVHQRDARWIEPDLAGGWSVALLPSARFNRIRAELPALLAELECLGIREIGRHRSRPDPLLSQAKSLGIATARQGGTDFPGSVYFTIRIPTQRMGGWVEDTGDALSVWISEWLAETGRANKLRKLAKSGLAERHLFVILPPFSTAPFQAFDVLLKNDAPAPTVTPTLPPEVTHVWAVSMWATGDGFRWSPDGGWARFGKVFDITADPA